MNNSRLKKQLVIPLAAAALFALALYVVGGFASRTDEGTGPMPYTLAMRLQEPGVWRRLLLVGLYISLAFVFVRVVGELFFLIFRKRKGYEAPSLLRDLFSLVAYIGLITLILHTVYPALSFGALLPGSALLGVILGLALQDTLGNLFAGISLHADKPFQVGDVITVGKWTGVVESITWRAVKIRNFSNHVILLNNSSMSKESIEVCPRTNPNARLVFFNALYTDSPVKVIGAVREAVREAENVLRYMTPVVRIRGLGDSGVDYEVKYWLDDYARYNDTDALVRQRIWYAFRRAGLNFAYPTRTLYITRDGDAGQQDGKADGITDRLSTVDIFAPLTADELTRLARNCRRHVFAPGEPILRAGEQGASMFVVNEGRVEIKVEDHTQQMRTVNSLAEGDFFGEMALFTGEPRTASVVAAEETEVFEIGYEAMKRLFDTNPDLVESIGHTIAERRAGLAAQVAAAGDEEKERDGLLASIRRFFRLD